MNGAEVIEQLRRWADSGAIWRVVDRRPARVVIALLTCTAGEEVGRIVSTDPDVLAFVGARSSSEQP